MKISGSDSGELIFSPSDLVRYIDSPFASWMARHALECPDSGIEKDPADALLSYLAEKGIEHESRFLEALRSRHGAVVTIPDDLDDTTKLSKTMDAMRDGADVIFQACLEKLPFRGYADFLIKVDAPSDLGEYSYVAWDTKLAREMKPYFVIQLCCYSEMLGAMQGARPQSATVVLGTNEEVPFLLGEYFDYYLAKKCEFLAQQESFDAEQMPDPFLYASHGEWTGYVEERRQDTDHLSRIANITRLQIQRLESAGIVTCADLATTNLARIPRLHDEIFSNLKHQAAIQARSAEIGTTAYQVRTRKSGMPSGLSLMPPADAADLFWDLEGFPLEEGGLEYLWGCTYLDDQGERQFWERWAHDQDHERQAFVAFIQFAYQRWRANPGMHIYHYGHYEVSVCQRLMGRYSVCEFEVDQLLRHGVFVDLYKIVREGLFVGEPAYSIKNIEHLYRGKRDTDVASGGESVVVYAKWREAPDGEEWSNSQILSSIRDYNIDDCDSTLELAQWLRRIQAESGILYEATGEPADAVEEREPDELDILQENLLALADSTAESDENRFLARHLAHLVLFYRREHKPTWWRFFERSAMSFTELYDDPDCLAGCRRTDRVPFKKTPRARKLVYEYTYDTNQEFRNRRFSEVYVLGSEAENATVESIDTESGTFLLSKMDEPVETIDIIANEWVNPKPIVESLLAIGQKFLDSRELNKPLHDYLIRKPPDVDRDLLIAIDQATGDDKLVKISEAVTALNNSLITLQGPLGTGKTFTASRVILNLLRLGKSVGVCSNGHKAIDNLLISIHELCESEGESFPISKVKREDDELFEQYPFHQIPSTGDIGEGIQAGGCVVGASAWGFSRPEAFVDYLFIDEAGQVSIANLAAMSPQAENIVCLGDQMQLPQPVQGSHPEDSSLSILDYFLLGQSTVPPDMGIFLNRTYRMHENVNRFISEAIYGGRLGNDPACDLQEIHLEHNAKAEISASNGIRYIEVPHSGNKQASLEEVECIASLIKSLEGSTWTDKKGADHPVEPKDILVVAPFNYQVNELKKKIGNSARVGTVDLFQGQEAPVVIISMTASTAEDSARGLDFLLSKNRINVAISRAQALAVVVAGNSLLEGSPNRLSDIRLYNLFYKLRDYAFTLGESNRTISSTRGGQLAY